MCRMAVVGSAACYEGDDDVGGVTVEVLSASVVDGGGARVSVAGGKLHVSERDAGVKRSHDERCSQHVRVDMAETGAFADGSHPPLCGTPIQPVPVAPQQDRASVAFADGEINRAGGPWDEWNDGRSAAFAHDPKCAMTPLESEAFDVGRAGFGDSEPVEAEEDGEPGVGSVEVFGSEQEPSELTAVHGVLFGGWDLGAANVLGGVGADSAVDVREPVVAAHGRQSPVDR